MKTITLDFETYENELKDARREGSKIREEMIKEIKVFLDKSTGTMDDAFYESRGNLYKILEKLN